MGINELLSPPILLPLGTSRLSFRHSYAFEADSAHPTNGYDGGVLEIQIGTNAFTDITNTAASWIANGYNRKIDTGYSNPLAGRWAWSGTNGGFATTTVSLPPASAGQTIQLRWRAGTDNGNGGPGWWVDSISITGAVCCANTAPVLPLQTNLTINELTTLTVTNTATDAEAPPEVLSYSLLIAPTSAPTSGVTNALISTNGVITWTPTEAQGPDVYTVTTIVSNNANPPLSATNSFTVTVNEVNSAPVLTVPPNQTINELALWTANATAIDTDLPPNILTFELVSGPGGLTVGSNGLISWTPPQTQSPSTNAVTVRVFDNGVPSLSATNSFTVTVREVNVAPVLPVIPTQTVTQLTLLTVTNTAIETNIHALLSYALLNAPMGVGINTNGIITWTPSQAGTNLITTVATSTDLYDLINPQLSATNTFTVVVNTAAIPPPMIQSIVASTDVVTVTWTTVAGQTYRLQYKDPEDFTNWNSVTPDVTATGPASSATNTVGSSILRLYRVLLLP